MALKENYSFSFFGKMDKVMLEKFYKKVRFLANDTYENISLLITNKNGKVILIIKHLNGKRCCRLNKQSFHEKIKKNFKIRQTAENSYAIIL